MGKVPSLMSDSQIPGDGLDVFVPEDQAGKVDVVELEFDLGDGPVPVTEVAIAATVTEMTSKVKDGSDVVFAGKSQKESKITVQKSKTEDSSSIIRLENALTKKGAGGTKKR